MSETNTPQERTPAVEGEVLPPAGGVVDPEVAQKRRVEYNRLVRTARLANLILEKVDFKVSPEGWGMKQSLMTKSLHPTTRVMSNGLADGTCVGNVIWEVAFKYKSKTVVKCAASYIVSYDGVQDCSEEAVTLFLEHVGKVATYAYFRSLYAQLDWAANLGSAPLPVLQLQPKI